MTYRFVVGIWGSLTVLGLAGPAMAAQSEPFTDVLLKVKPAVVIIMTEVAGDVRLSCPNRSPQRVTPAPSRAHGSGFLVTSDGYIITNGHVVQPYYDKNDKDIRESFISAAIQKACLDSGLSDDRAQAAIRQLYPRVSQTAAVELKKTLTVILANQDKFVAEVKAYSPPLAERPGKQVSSDEGGSTESGKDVAVLKIDAKNLPTITLGDSDRVQVGQPVRILGFPGVVMYHDLLDKRSVVEASITSGLVSSLKRDARGAPVIQTDAAASWGNSGGPAVNEQGEVVGMLTFISLTSDETQAIQGFNFLVPVNIVKEFARVAGVSLDKRSPFNTVWHEAVDRYGRGDWAGAQSRLDAVNRLVPNLPDVQRLQTDVQLHLLQPSPSLSPLVAGSIGFVVLAACGAAWVILRRRRRPAPAAVTLQPVKPTEAVSAGPTPPPLHVSVTDLSRALAQRTDLVVVDVRTPASYQASPVQAKGALRASPEDILQRCGALSQDQGIILYCDSPAEMASIQAAQRLKERGYTRVAVLTGGFTAWQASSLPLERTPHAREKATTALPGVLSLPESEKTPALKAEIAVDLPVGIKGTGPYFNARAKALRCDGLFLATAEPLTMDQKLRLTIFLKGESLELNGRVTSVHPRPVGGRPQGAEITFDSLNEEAATLLEGFILAHWTGGPTS